MQNDLFDQSQLVSAGVDEAGRGPLAGPVFAAAVILDPAKPIAGLADSKTLTEMKRQELATVIKRDALSWAIASASVQEIDTLNILQASLLAMKRAVEALSVVPEIALVDGNQAPRLQCQIQTIIKGDSKVAAISAASILAKTARDHELLSLHQRFPGYAFDQHKGYGTALHLACLQRLGPCEAHRRTFAPVRRLLEKC
jgi:ribonuclease HII